MSDENKTLVAQGSTFEELKIATGIKDDESLCGECCSTICEKCKTRMFFKGSRKYLPNNLRCHCGHEQPKYSTTPTRDAYKEALMKRIQSDKDQQLIEETEEATSSKDLLFLRNTQEWPTFQDNETKFCCLRNDTQKKHGFLVEGSFVVHHGYIFNSGNGNATAYESFEAILADGWTID